MEPKGVASKLIAVDPGESSGIAVLNTDAPKATCEAFTVASDKGLRKLERLFDSLEEFDLVIEVMPPTRHNQEAGRQVKDLCLARTPAGRLHTVMPSAWKGHPMSVALKGEGNDRHQRDAIKMARWFNATHWKKARPDWQPA